jgi:hypothetical protein
MIYFAVRYCRRRASAEVVHGTTGALAGEKSLVALFDIVKSMLRAGLCR